MSQGINDFLRVAANLPDATPLHVEQDTVTQATYKHGVTRAENMQANTETARTFLQAVRSHPGFARGGNEIAAQLNNKIEKGLPLCADEVRTAVRQLNGGQATLVGERLEHAGILPQGTAALFAKHVLSTFGSLEGEHGVRASVRDFIIRHVIPTNVEAMTELDSALVGHNGPPLSAEEKKEIQAGLVAYRGAPDTESYLKKLLIENIAAGLLPNAPAHPEFGKGMADLARIGTNNLFVEANREEIQLLASLPAATRTEVLKDPDLLSTLIDNQHRLSHNEQVAFAEYVSTNVLPLTDNAERATAIRDCLLILSAQQMNQPLPEKLPATLAPPLAFNPEVKRNAIARLQADLPPGSIPTRIQTDAALLAARNEFALARAPLLNEFIQMATNPPAGLNIKPPLTPQTLPHYLNALLSGDAVLEPLLNDSHPVDAEFLHSALIYTQGMESTGDVDGKSIGVDGSNKLHKGVMQLLMARRGVEEKEYPVMMERGLARFGRAIAELDTLISACYDQDNDSAQRDAMSLRRVLNGTLMTMAQLLTPENRAALSLPADAEDMLNELFSPIKESVDLKDFSTKMYEFGTSLGVQLPPPNNAVAMSTTERQLLDANNKIVDSTLARILGDAKQLRDRTLPFVEMVNDIIADLQLNNLKSSLLEPKLFFDNASKLLHKRAAEAASQNATLNEGALRAALRGAIVTSLTGMESVMAQIDSLPTPGHLSKEQHAELKRIMKEMVHMYPIADVAVLSRMMDRAASANGVVDKLRAPLGTPLSLATAFSTLSSDYADLAHELGAKNMPPQHVALPCFLDMALRSSKVDTASASLILDNMTGAAAKSVAASYNFIMDSNSYTAQQKVKPQLSHTLMTHLTTVSEFMAKGTATHNPQLFSEKCTHLSEVPTGCLSTIVPNNTTIQQKLNLFGSRLSTAEWDILERTGNALTRGMSYRDEARLADMLASNASNILKVASAAGNPAVLNLNQVATGVLGSPLTSSEKKNGNTDGQRLSNAFASRYTKEVRQHIPNVSAANIQLGMQMGMANGYSYPVLKNLATPEGKLTLADVPPEALELGSLGNYTAENAYGLREDFPRLNGGSITLNIAEGNTQTYSPSVLPKGGTSIPADHEVFKGIIAGVTKLASADAPKVDAPKADAAKLAPPNAQMLRVMHIFTQAGRKCVGMSTRVFPSEAQNVPVPSVHYAVARTPDGAIAVSMKSLENNPLHIEQEFLVNKDGGYKITHFLMERRSANATNPA